MRSTDHAHPYRIPQARLKPSRHATPNAHPQTDRAQHPAAHRATTGKSYGNALPRAPCTCSQGCSQGCSHLKQHHDQTPEQHGRPDTTSENSTAHKPGPQPQAGRPHAPPCAGTLYKTFHQNLLVFSMNEIVASIIILFVEIFRLSLPYKSKSNGKYRVSQKKVPPRNFSIAFPRGTPRNPENSIPPRNNFLSLLFFRNSKLCILLKALFNYE